MHLFINSLAASAGGGLTYIRNVIPHLDATPGLRVTVVLATGLREEFRSFPNITFIESQASGVRRLWYEQTQIPHLIGNCHADVLLSAGNFALRNSPVPQILLSRNSIYTSADFYRDLRSRHDYGAWLDTRLRAILAKRSIHWADATVAPSEAFAAELHRWTGVNIRAIHHGFDREVFTRDSSPLASEVEGKLKAAEGSLKLLFVSHYNYYRNFETLIRALPLVRDRLPGRSVKLLLTCKLAAGANPGEYRPEAAATLVRELGVTDMVVELGAIPYAQLHQVYRRADIYVTPAYTETFAHPLVEAMASGLPIVASDLPVHGEICADAALYFSLLSSSRLSSSCLSTLELASRVVEVASSADLAARLSARGITRASDFSWRKHVDELMALARSLVAAES